MRKEIQVSMNLFKSDCVRNFQKFVAKLEFRILLEDGRDQIREKEMTL